ncbi:PfkB family carbohydrate kinase [Rhodobacter lacus]|uniref:PfkB family carbohydrate kinase n=1 Tax=Rhodobacter lacus TaxID=1641972 RepID=A0ABW5A6F5_9RHOB
MTRTSPESRHGILVVGSLHYDIMVEADHLPRRDETGVGSRWYPKFGGKGGNQAVAAARAGAPVRMLGAVGADDFGAFLTRHLAQAGVDGSAIAVIDGVGSGMSVAIADATGDYAATIVSGANLHIDPARLADPALWRGVGAVVLQNEVPEAVNLAAALGARAHGAKVLLNAAPARTLSPEFAALVDVLVVNAVEAEMLGTAPVTDLATAQDAALTLAARFGAVVVTAGAAGLALVDANDRAFTIPATRVKAVSSHGAGDCFTGTLAERLTRSLPLGEACAAASAAAARHVAGG